MNRDAETVPARHETPDVAELRRLLDVNRERDFHVLPWHAWDRGIGYELHVGATCRDEMEPRGYCEEVNNSFRETFGAPEAELIVAAVNALPALLDAAAERDRLARLLDEPRRSGCAVEIAGVRIAPCDERGQTADMRERDTLADRLAHMTEARNNARAEVERLTALVEAVREYAAARQANIDHGPLLSARKAAHDALLAALARLDEEPES